MLGGEIIRDLHYDPSRGATLLRCHLSQTPPLPRSPAALKPEIGHSILDVTGPETARQVGKLLWGGRAMPVSILAKKDPEEYFCETLAAYRFEDGLADKDPQGYDMVEAILRMVCKK